jgi:formate hydrogenlyase subunit 3/multisubunit Na+/H+ antiporter MnhD subunit
MAGLRVVSVKVLSTGGLDMEDLKAKAEKYKDQLAAFMVRIFFLSVLTLIMAHTWLPDHVSFDVRCLRRWGPRGVQDHP